MSVNKLLLAGWVAAALAGPGTASAQAVAAGIEKWRAGDSAGAVAIWRKAAIGGDADAAFNLGQAYRLGKGITLDLAAAQGWYERAARQGHVDAQATLGMMLFQSGDRIGGIRWLKSAAVKGEPRAMLLYGTALFNGDGVAPDPVTAYAYVSRSAAQGLPPAKATLADMDEAMPLDLRQKGVAMAQAMVAGGTTPARAVEKAKSKATAKPTRPVAAVPVATAPVASVPVATAPVGVAPAALAGPATSIAAGWRIQLGAFGQQGKAQALFSRLGHGVLAGKTPYYVATGGVIRLQVGPYPSKGAAAAACAALRGQACFAVPGR